MGDSLYRLLSSLPSLRNVDLDTIWLRSDSGTYRSLLQDLKENLADSEDGPLKETKPQITVRKLNYEGARRTPIDKEVSKFLYGGGASLFQVIDPNFIDFGFGWELDDFDDSYRFPPVDPSAMHQIMRNEGGRAL